MSDLSPLVSHWINSRKSSEVDIDSLLNSQVICIDKSKYEGFTFDSLMKQYDVIQLLSNNIIFKENLLKAIEGYNPTTQTNEPFEYRISLTLKHHKHNNQFLILFRLVKILFVYDHSWLFSYIFSNYEKWTIEYYEIGLKTNTDQNIKLYTNALRYPSQTNELDVNKELASCTGRASGFIRSST